MRANAEAMAARQGLSCVRTELYHLNPALSGVAASPAASPAAAAAAAAGAQDDEAADAGAADAGAAEVGAAIEAPGAYVLVVRHGASLMLGATDTTHATTLASYEAELRALNVDKQALMRGRVVNKHARWNVCFDTSAQSPDYAAGKGTVVPWDVVPHTRRIRESLVEMHPSLANIKAEYNDYYDVSVCGIGYHGDSERREVVAVRVGASLPIYYQWFHRSKPVGPRQVVPLGGDDLYVMSEKAVGTDWKKSSIMTLRHSAGCDKFTVLKPARPTVAPPTL